MLSNFSWLAYGTFTLVSLLIYYAVILLLYYRQEMKMFFQAFLDTAADKNRTAQKQGLLPVGTEEPDLLVGWKLL